MKQSRLLVILLFALLYLNLNAYQNSFFNLVSPTELSDWQGEVSIQHRFRGATDDEPLDTFFGTTGGVNVGLFYRQALLHKAELKLGYIRTNMEYNVDASWLFTPYDFPVQAQANLHYFTYEDFFDTDKRYNNIMFLLALQSQPLMDKIILNANVGYETDKERMVSGLGLGYKVLPEVTFMAEYYPDNYNPSAFQDIQNFNLKNDSFTLGVKLETYGHHFMFLVGNSDSMTLRRLTMGSETKDLRLGFNINRRF